VEGSGTEIVNGIYLESANPPVLYMSDRFRRFHIFQFDAGSESLSYGGNAGIERANMTRGYGASVDEAAGLMAVAYSGELSIYDIGHTSGSPVSPVLRSTKTLTISNANAVALKYPIVHVSQQFSSDGPLTFEVSNPSNPVPLDQEFWDPSHAWNSLGICLWNNHTVFSDDGAAMYLSRYSSLQVIDPTACAGPIAPLANLNLSPQPAFPGDLLTVTNTSTSGDRYATWITDGPNPHGDTILAGVTTFSSGTSLGYTLLVDMAAGDVFYAHAAVETDEFPYDPGGSTPDQIKTVQVSIDRTPEATITITPPAAVTGDDVTLSAGAEGQPGGVSPFEWTVTPPTQEPIIFFGQSGHVVTLNESGQWIFDLVVQYEHEAAVGGLYQTTAQEIRDISSVAAAFGVTPSNPVHNETITLTSSSAAQAGANLDFDWDVLTTSGTLVHELGFCDGPGAINDQCVIPAETLTWGTYDFRLTLVNTNNSDQDVALIEDFEVLNGNIQVDFTFFPTNPEIGDFVGFQVTGVSAQDIERAVWTFGGAGCDGSTGYTCVEPNFPSCDQAAFAYASGGTKTVRVTVTTTGGVQQPQVSNNIVVQNTGSCGGTTCTYGISPTVRNFTLDGGVDTITVNTTPNTGCGWTASENSAWISITSGSSGGGDGTVTYSVQPNTGEARSAVINVVGGGNTRVHTVNQASGVVCNYGLTTHSAVFGPPGSQLCVAGEHHRQLDPHHQRRQPHRFEPRDLRR